MFLEEPDSGIDEHDGANRGGVEHFAERRGQDAGGHQEPDDGARELARQQGEGGGRPLSANLVPAELSQPAGWT